MANGHFSHFGISAPRAQGQTDDDLGHGYPRPQLRRRRWSSLNGPWNFAIDADAQWHNVGEVTWGPDIQVPYAPETARSGIGNTGLYRRVWYRRTFRVPARGEDRVLLHFGAVDSEATVWVNGHLAGRHSGGYAPFHFDVTALLNGEEETVVVCADDDPADLCKPRGKQDWQLEPHSIWYQRTTGIWQTVWVEQVPKTHIASLRWTSNLERWEIGVAAMVEGAPRDTTLRCSVTLRWHSVVLADDSYLVVAGEVHRRIALSDPGIDDFRNELLWSPATPNLIEAELRLLDAHGNVLDSVRSYTALRTFTRDKDRLMLNGRPYPLRLVLDQGYWPETGMTAPDDESLRRDVELARAMGFNGVRKHQKIEDPRYLYWADRLGLLVWEEMPSAYRFSQKSVERVVHEWMEIMKRDLSHPCIVAWVPFNESWGVPNLPDSPAERNYVQAMYHLTRTIDPSRLVVGNDGWESVATDIIGIHDYDAEPQRIARRYLNHESGPRFLSRERPGGRVLVLEGGSVTGQAHHPLVLSEFGGISYAPKGAPEAAWGYSSTASADDFAKKYAALLETVHALEPLSGFCYTQFADTFQETNGLLFADRTPKFPLESIHRATRAVTSRG